VGADLQRSYDHGGGHRPSGSPQHNPGVEPAKLPRTKSEIEEIVTLIRLDLYNHDLSCGPKKIREKMEREYALKTVLSERTISRILARRGLTHRRTGWYPGEEKMVSKAGNFNCR
jgi:hypothetical protein